MIMQPGPRSLTGVLLVHVGSPDVPDVPGAPATRAAPRYLNECLGDRLGADSRVALPMRHRRAR